VELGTHRAAATTEATHVIGDAVAE
jgi:hypothetical protein